MSNRSPLKGVVPCTAGVHRVRQAAHGIQSSRSGKFPSLRRRRRRGTERPAKGASRVGTQHLGRCPGPEGRTRRCEHRPPVQERVSSQGETNCSSNGATRSDSGIGKDVGDEPQEAEQGDIVVTYLGPDGTPSHVGLVATTPTDTSEATVDAHNNARYHYGYHYYAPSHLVRLVPNALLEVQLWTVEEAIHSTPHRTPPTANRLPAPSMSDPAGPRV